MAAGNGALVARAMETYAKGQLIVRATRDLIDAIPELEWARDDLLESLLDLKQSIWSSDAGKLVKLIDEAVALMIEIQKILEDET